MIMARPAVGPGSRPAAGSNQPLRRLRAVIAHPQFALALLTLFYSAIVSCFAPEMISLETGHDVMAALAPLAILAVGQSFVLLVGQIDLSVTASMSLASVIAASVITLSGGPLGGSALAAPAALAIFVTICAAIGAFNGFCVVKLHMPSFLVSLAAMIFLGGAALWFAAHVAEAASVGDLPAAFTALGYGEVFGAPIALLIAAALALAAYGLTARTVLGRWMQAIGLNPVAARVSGARVEGAVLAAFVLSGLYAGVAGAIMCARLETGTPMLAQKSLLLDIVGAAIVGGVSLSGGRGGVGGAPMGALLLTVIDKGLQLLGLSDFVVMSAKGGVILLAALSDGLRQRAMQGQA
jgi:ribose/xylose/arabinose/galactoside ABC-type transport system permease subunit